MWPWKVLLEIESPNEQALITRQDSGVLVVNGVMLEGGGGGGLFGANTKTGKAQSSEGVANPTSAILWESPDLVESWRVAAFC